MFVVCVESRLRGRRHRLITDLNDSPEYTLPFFCRTSYDSTGQSRITNLRGQVDEVCTYVCLKGLTIIWGSRGSYTLAHAGIAVVSGVTGTVIVKVPTPIRDLLTAVECILFKASTCIAKR